MSFRTPRSVAARRGTILFFIVILLLIAGTSVLFLTDAVNHNIRNTQRTEDRLKAFYVAESGVQHVVDWFNRPALSPQQSYFAPKNPAGQVDLLEGSYLDANGDSIIKSTYAVAANTLPVIDSVGSELFDGKVTSLIISPPLISDPKGTVCRVKSVGEIHDNVRSTVEVSLYTNSVPAIFSPAAIISKAVATSGGQFNVHWGEVWAKGNLELTNPLNSKFPRVSEDQWYAGRAENWLVSNNGGNLYANGAVKGAYSATQIAANAGNYYMPFKESMLHADNKKGGPNSPNNFMGHENLFQKQKLSFPEYDYTTMKLFCLQRGFPVYQTTSDGMLLVNGTKQTFEATFGDPRDPDDINFDELPEMAFIDTVDGTAPKPDGSNMTTLTMSGGEFYRGFYFMAANVKVAGQGSAAVYNNPVMPDKSIYNKNIKALWLAGLFYSYGTFESNGNNSVYGSLHAQNGYSGGGSWDVYYDYRLKDKNRYKVASKLSVRLWNTY